MILLLYWHCLKFKFIQDSFFVLSLFSMCNMVDSMDIDKSLNINIGTVMKNPEMLINVPDLLKTIKKCVRMQLKKLPYQLR